MGMKGLIGLLAVTVVAVIAAIFVARGGGTPASDPLVGSLMLPEIGQRLGDIGDLAMVRGDQKITLKRQGDQWAVEEKDGYPANLAKLKQALIGLAELRFVEPKTRKPDLYARLEVEDAGKKGAKSTLVTVSDAKGSLLGEVIAGKRRIDQLGGGNDGIYVRKPGDAQSWLARGTLDLSGDAAQWLDQKVIDVPQAEVKQVVLTGADGATLTIERAKPEDKLALAELPAGRKLKSEDALDDPASALAGLELADVKAAKDAAFPGAGVSHAKFTTFEGLVVTVDILDKDGNGWLRLTASGEGAAATQASELNAKLSPWVYVVSSFKAKTLQTKLADLLEPQKPS
jgi:hypothetical protein